MKTESIFKKAEYFPIPVSSLQIESILDFSLYYYVKEKNLFILYRSSNLKIEEKHLENLIKSNIRVLYIRSDQKDKYFDYVVQNLPSILNSEERTITQKIEIVTSLAQILAQKLFVEPLNEEIGKKAYSIFYNTNRLIQEDPNAFTQLIKILEENYELSTHALNVSLYSLGLASKLNIFNTDELIDICLGALYHDVGKLSIPNYILSKKGKLTKHEREIVKKHPIEGLEMVVDFKILKNISKNIILLHHEKLDGSGYPLGLKKEQIPIEAQIVGITDIFDALTTNRIFRKALTSFKALKLMMNEFSSELNQKLLKEFILLLKF